MNVFLTNGEPKKIKIGKVEHYVVSSVSQFIPETVRQKWHEYWRSVKSAEIETLGHDAISDKVEMAGWGVEEAQKHHKEEASMCTSRQNGQAPPLGRLVM